MPFARTAQKDEEEYPARMTWEGDERSAREICNWARDEALLPFAAVTPPHRDAAEGSPAADWQMKLKIEVPATMGGGTQWVDVPKGATILHAGTRVDPVFSIRPAARQAATTFTEE